MVSRSDSSLLGQGSTRKVRTPQDSAGVNDPPPQGEEQWNRENVQGIDPKAGHGRPRGSRWSENSQTLRGARSNREARRKPLEAFDKPWSTADFRVRSLELWSNPERRGIVASCRLCRSPAEDRIRLIANPSRHYEGSAAKRLGPRSLFQINFLAARAAAAEGLGALPSILRCRWA